MVEISLGYWILGLDGSNVFQVHIARSETVDQLKDAIKEENDHVLNHITARQLKIWKLKDPLSSRDIANTFAKIGAGDEVPNADKLDPMNKLSRYFSEPLVEDVQLPLSGTAISPWSSAGLASLQTVSRSSQDISGIFIRNEYVQALKDIVAFCKGEQFAPNINNAESSVALTPFPNTIANPFAGTEFPTEPRRCGVIVTGSPGIGKSVLLDVILHLRNLAGCETIFVQDQRRGYVFNSSGVFRMSDDEIIGYQPLPSVWVLVDSNGDVTGVPVWVTRLGCFVVQAASPKLRRMEWESKEINVSRYILKPWSLEEALAARMLQTRVQPSEIELKMFFERHIPSARVAYHYASSIQIYERDKVPQLYGLSLQDVLKTIYEAFSFRIRNDLFYRIFVILPDQNRRRHVIQFTSQHWVDIVVSMIKKDKVIAEAQELFAVFKRGLSTAGAAGQLLDSVIGDIFALGGVWKIHEMEKSPRPGPKGCHWKIRASSTYADKYLIIGHPNHPPFFISEHPPEDTVFQHIETHILSSTPADSVALCTGYYLPASQTDATFDSFYYEAKIKQVTVLQLAVSKHHHSMKIKGLKWLKDLGVESIRYIAVTGPQQDFDLTVPNEYSNPACLEGMYHLALNSLT